MEMCRSRRAGQAGIGQLVCHLLAGGVIIDIGRALGSAGVGRNLGLAVERRLELLGEGGAGEGDDGCKSQRGKRGLGHALVSLLRSGDGANLATRGIVLYSPFGLLRRNIFSRAMAGAATFPAIRYGSS